MEFRYQHPRFAERILDDVFTLLHCPRELDFLFGSQKVLPPYIPQVEPHGVIARHLFVVGDHFALRGDCDQFGKRLFFNLHFFFYLDIAAGKEVDDRFHFIGIEYLFREHVRKFIEAYRLFFFCVFNHFYDGGIEFYITH